MAASSQSSRPEESTFTEMSVGDVEAVGRHCELEYCHRLDFLPFKCLSCKKTFCLDHRSETAHRCENEGAYARAKTGIDSYTTSKPSQKPSILTHEKQCASTKCKTLIDTPLSLGVHCETCRRSYCLKHRFKEDHDCKSLPRLDPPSAIEAQRERGLNALKNLRAWANKKAAAANSANKSILPKSSKGSASARVAATHALKTTAKGDNKITPEKRVYLFVNASADTTTAKIPEGKFFYSKDWSIGRVLDAAAKGLQVQNVNNRVPGEEEKLRVYHVEGGRLLDFSEKVGDVLQTGNTIVLLRGVGPGVPDLITV